MGFVFFIDHTNINCFTLNQTTFAYGTYHKRTALKHSGQMKCVSIAQSEYLKCDLEGP